MTETPMKVIVDCSTGESISVPLTAQELAQRETDQLAWEAQEATRLAAEAEQQALKESANAKLAALGLTADEIAAITR
jgi:aspartokinase